MGADGINQMHTWDMQECGKRIKSRNGNIDFQQEVEWVTSLILGVGVQLKWYEITTFLNVNS